MKFIQIMEFEGEAAEATQAIENYIEQAGDKTFVKKAMLCVDRDASGTIVQLIEFASFEDAERNNELEATDEGHVEGEESFGEIRFRNLDVIGEYVL